MIYKDINEKNIEIANIEQLIYVYISIRLLNASLGFPVAIASSNYCLSKSI
jgi:hypothetical protein